MELYRETVDIRDVLESCRQLIAGRAEDAGLVVAVEWHDEGPLTLQADLTKLKQVLLNLLSNAVKFTPCGGKITISVECVVDQWIKLTVADTGIGMTAVDLVVAMEPFRQVDNSHTRRYQGTGLGLPLVKALVELHGGEFRIESQPGTGTTATVLLPNAATVSAAA
jgi:signal transduction histidine kinase